MKNSKFIWVMLAIVVVVAIGAFIWVRKQKDQNLNQKTASVENVNQTAQEQTTGTQDAVNVPEGTTFGGANNGKSPEEKRSSEKPDEALRQQIIAYINQNLSKLTPPPKNDQWDIPTFYFVGNSIVYVELYAVDTDLSGLELLYKVEKEGSGFKLNQLAKKTEGEEDWILKEGKDDYSDYVLEEYDLNEDNNKWEKTDEFSEAEYDGEETAETDNTSYGITP